MLVQKTKIGQAAKKRLIALAGFMIVSFVCAGLIFKTDVQAAEGTDKVRVVLPNIDNAGYINIETGEVTGYFMDFLTEIAKHTGWEYDIRIVSDPQELLEIAENKDFDLMLGVDYSDENDQKYFDYADMDMGFKHLVVATTKTHMSLTKRDLYSLRGAKIGVTTTEDNQNLKEKFVSYCFTNGLKCRTSIKADPQGVTLLTTPEEGIFQSLQNGYIDAILCSDATALENNLFTVSDFGMVALYPVVPEGDRRYIRQLNAALEHMDAIEAGFVDRLYEKHFASNYVRVLAFNSVEREFLETERTYRVAIGGESAPYTYQKADGTWAGVAVEVFNEITRMTGDKLKFEIVGCESMEAAGEAIANDEADIVGMSFPHWR